MKMNHAEFELTTSMVIDHKEPRDEQYEPTAGSLIEELRLLGDVMHLDRLTRILKPA